MTKIKPKGTEVVIYKSSDGNVQMEVNLKKDTVWLTQSQIALLFGVKVPAISKHVSNIYKTKELFEKSTLSKMEIVQKEGERLIRRNSDVYNLDIIISVGYRVNSQKATQFRIWATKVIKNHLLNGYTVNEKVLSSQKSRFQELRNAINFIEDKSHDVLLKDQSADLLSIIRQYTKSLDLLEQYDKKNIKRTKGSRQAYALSVSITKDTIQSIRKNLMETKKNLGFFGVESSDKIADIIGNLNQTYGGKELYRSIEERAANLLYMIIKDHPFIDGNKRIGSLLFIQYLDNNDILYRKTGERKINDNALVALALLVAISNPNEKDILIKVITSIISQ